MNDDQRPGGPGGQQEEPQEQLDLLPALAEARAEAAAASERAKVKGARRATVAPAAELPVARVLVEVPLAHLDRPFDYLVPAALHEEAVPGCRVKVRFAGQDVDGLLIERVQESDHPGRLAPLRRVVSAEPVLSPAVAELTGLVAERYAGTRADVLRLAVPPRHATVEKEPPRPPAPFAAPTGVGRRLVPLHRRHRLSSRPVRAGGSPRAVWTALPGEDWATRLAEAAAVASAQGEARCSACPTAVTWPGSTRPSAGVLGAGQHVTLSADLGPAERYRSFLAVSRGAVRVVAGTRAAAFAPVHDLGLVAIWDDGDDLFAEPRAPYPHTREVLLLRAHHDGCAALVAGTARSVEASALVGSGWAREVVADRDTVRARAPRVAITGATDRELERDPMTRSSRLPSSAYVAVRTALEHGPVLVQTPRAGYAESLVCDTCRAPARCPRCTGPLHLTSAHEPPELPLVRCGPDPEHACPGVRRPRAARARAGRPPDRRGAGPGVPPGARARSAGDRVLDAVDGHRAIVVATPGAEPPADGGYAAVVLLDTWLMLARPDLRDRGGVGAAVAQRRHAGSTGGRGRAGHRGRRPGAARSAGAGPVGPGRVRRAGGRAAQVRPSAADVAARGAVRSRGTRSPRPSPPCGCPREPRCSARCRSSAAGERPADRFAPRGPSLRPAGGPRGRAGAPPARIRALPGAPRAAGGAVGPQAAHRCGSRSTPTRWADLSPASVDLPRAAPGAVERSHVSVQPIRLFGDPVLRTPAQPVVDFDAELRKLVKDLTETMVDAPGAGLAAPQIGVGLRVFTWYVDGELGHLVNPDLSLSEETQDGEEGCLSLPGIVYPCIRAMRVVATGWNMHGEPVTIEGSELLARAIQHETDHLDGILFVERLDAETRKQAMRAIRESEWFGAPPPTIKVSPHPTRGLGL